MLHYLFTDHLGRASVSYRADDAAIVGQRYHPWGEVKGYSSNQLPTDYTYTGQEDVGFTRAPDGYDPIRILDYGARYYWPYFGRFISPDTIAPEPGNPQALNRYAYANNNALRYTDPTGFFTEDEIMQYLDVNNWDAVLAMFGEGGQFENRWGFLAVLREAELGTYTQVLKDRDIWFDTLGDATILSGIFSEDKGVLSFATGWGNFSLKALGNMGDSYNLRSEFGDGGYHMGLFWANRKYSNVRVERDIDWVGVGFDAAGIIADAVSFGTAGRFVQAAQVARKAEQIGKALDVVGTGYEIGAAAAEYRQEGDVSPATQRSLLYSGAGFVPGLGTASDAVSLFDALFYWGP